MEKNKKNQISAFLMVVGVLFILVAGTIFVTTAWKQLPLIAKQALLLCISVGLFAGAKKVSKSGNMKKTEATLFYLGVAFAGFFTISVLGQISGYVSDTVLMPKAFSMMTACIVMIIPTLIRFLKQQKGLDFTIAVILTDGVIGWFSNAFELSGENFILILAGMILLFALGDYYKEKWIQKRQGLDTAFTASYLLHVMGYVGLILEEALEKELLFSQAIVLVAASLLIYMRRKDTFCRLLNSLTIIWCAFTTVDYFNSIFPEEIKMSNWGNLFAMYIVILVITVFTLRTELICYSIVFSVVISYAQLISYGGYYILFYYVPHTVTVYIPFTVAMMIGLSLIVKRKLDQGKIIWEEDGQRMAKAIGMQILTVLILVQGSFLEGFIRMGMHGLTMVFFLTAVVLKKKNDIGKGILYTCALIAGEMAVLNQPYFEILKGYRVEWVCFMLGIGIVLLHGIWYDKAKGIKVVNFVLTCILLTTLLFNDIIQGGLGNVIILGVVGVIMLIVAALFNQREYVILSSVTLILLILYITRSFWLSIAWWVYLFVAGVILVLLAIKKEKEM